MVITHIQTFKTTLRKTYDLPIVLHRFSHFPMDFPMALPLDSCSSNVGVSSAATAAGFGAAGPGSAMGGGSEAS